MQNFETRNKTSFEQAYWKQAEKDVLQYFLSNGCQGEMLEAQEWQFKDIDMRVVFPDGREHFVSVKYMPAVAKYCNLSFELATIARNEERLDGWFIKDYATLTAIVIPDIVIECDNSKRQAKHLSNNNRILLFSCKKLKEVVPKISFKTTRLTPYQKQFNINSGRKYIDSENLIVRLEDLLPYCLRDIIIKNEQPNYAVAI